MELNKSQLQAVCHDKGPVSYTHLIEVKEIRLSPNIDTNDLNTKAVSYTHLDVYKRQVVMYQADANFSFL